MNKTLDKIIFVVIAAVVVGLVGYSLFTPKTVKPFGASQTNYLQNATMSTSTIGASNWTKISAKTSRDWSIISNLSGIPIYLSFGTTTYKNATMSYKDGIMIATSSDITFDLDHDFTGDIYGITASGSSTVSIVNFKP